MSLLTAAARGAAPALRPALVASGTAIAAALLSHQPLAFRGPEFVYVQNVTDRSAVVAWGGPRDRWEALSLLLGRRSALLGALGFRSNDVGRSSAPFGPAELAVVERDTGRPVPGSPFRTTQANWLEVPLPRPDTDYGYELRVNGRPFGDSVYGRDGLLHFRTFPDPAAPSPPLAFLVIGDYGTGDERQLRLARALGRLADERERQGRPVRFVVTTGDNLDDQPLGIAAGGDDRQFFVKVLGPYERLMSRLPFYPALGNHDGSESELAEDLTYYRDNFFLPPATLADGRLSAFPGRFYAFSFGRDVRFMCLDSTWNEETLPGLTWVPLADNGGRSEQLDWLAAELAARPEAPFRVAYFHHPLHSAAREYRRSQRLERLARILAPRLEEGGVRLVLNGHAHNFQLGRPAGPEGPTYVVSGPAGEEIADPLTAPEDVAALRRAGIEVTSAARTTSFLLVEIEAGVARVFPLGCDPVSGQVVPLALFGTAEGGPLTASAAGLYQPLRIAALPSPRAVAAAAASADPATSRSGSRGRPPSRRGGVPGPA